MWLRCECDSIPEVITPFGAHHFSLSLRQDARGDQCDQCAGTFSSPTELLQPRCKRNKAHKLSVRPSTHSCLRLDALQPKLERWLQEARIKGKWASNAVVLANGEIVEPRMKGGLRPTAVTRDLTWGVPVPKVGIAEEDEAMKGKVMCECRFVGTVAE